MSLSQSKTESEAKGSVCSEGAFLESLSDLERTALFLAACTALLASCSCSLAPLLTWILASASFRHVVLFPTCRRSTGQAKRIGNRQKIPWWTRRRLRRRWSLKASLAYFSLVVSRASLPLLPSSGFQAKSNDSSRLRRWQATDRAD